MTRGPAAYPGRAEGTEENALSSPSGTESIVQRLADAVRANFLRFDEPDVRLSPEEACRLAEEVVERLVRCDAFPRLMTKHGFLFVVEEDVSRGGGEDVLHVLVWNGNRWVSVETLSLGTP